ncbi:hypothetical protein KDA_51250 [Dictyobacter alpinus]|uniref:Transporter suffix domain-containing protein n=1 Tax=Dictyobacter alpinus TaxID=2014873 RepID=A0A402BDX8_9CHLR|nr:transporter suffix domain-containing protein [Dictyobacter alpinus]GCE29641.1 hypothetical protein KDA_51250 [Dictyobacter alpinus]
MHTSEIPQSPSAEKKRWLWLGATLIVLSTLLWVCLFALPFLPVNAGAKVGIGVGLAVIAEITFWIGGALVGTRVIARYRRFLNPRRWLKERGGQIQLHEQKNMANKKM